MKKLYVLNLDKSLSVGSHFGLSSDREKLICLDSVMKSEAFVRSFETVQLSDKRIFQVYIRPRLAIYTFLFRSDSHNVWHLNATVFVYYTTVKLEALENCPIIIVLVSLMETFIKCGNEREWEILNV